MVIDVHNHVIPGEYIKAVERDGAALAARIEIRDLPPAAALGGQEQP